jgi:hypothetical protein
MKKNPILAFLITALIFLFCQCKKYPEGDNFTIRTAKGRVTGHHWTMSSSLLFDSLYTYSGASKYVGWIGTETTSYTTPYVEMNFEKNGSFTFSVNVHYSHTTLFSSSSPAKIGGSGKWEFVDRKKKIKLTYDSWMKNGISCSEALFSNGSSETYDIIKLYPKSMKWSYPKDGTPHVMTFEHCY